ncbi:MAG: hypothetical protein ACYCZO_04570 [Daejeonella sp.]
MKSTLVIFLALIFFSLGCKKNNQSAKFDRSTGIEISIKNAEGSDLLNPQNSGSIKAADIDIYFLKNGEKVRVFDGMMHLPESFEIKKYDNGKYFLNVGLSEYPDNKNISTTYIEFKHRGTDTITVEIVKKPSVVYFTKLWYNSELKWGGNNEQGIAHFDIVK